MLVVLIYLLRTQNITERYFSMIIVYYLNMNGRRSESYNTSYDF